MTAGTQQPNDPSGTPPTEKGSAEEPEVRPLTQSEAQRSVRGDTGFRQMPRTAARALRFVYDAAPRQLTNTVLLQVVAGAALGAQLLIGRELLTQLIAQPP